MSAEGFGQQNTDNAVVDTETPIDFSLSRSTLQRDQGGYNIASVIAQLLQIYRPEDDITAYERVLKKVQDLLRDCDVHQKQLLLSMIPAPKNASDHMVAKIFQAATGFVKLSLLKSNSCRNASDVDDTTKTADSNVPALAWNFSRDGNVSSSKSSYSEGLSFRGFAESEISTTAESLTCQLNSHSENWSEGSKTNRSDKYQMSPRRRYLLDENCAPNACTTRAHDSTEIVDLRQDKVSRRPNDLKYECKKNDDTDGLKKDAKSVAAQATADPIDQNAAVEWTIKNSIHRMDVCQDEDENIIIDADELLPTVNDRLKASLSNFLKRAREGIAIELSAFPRTRSYPRLVPTNPSTETRKPATARKGSEKNPAHGLPSDSGCLPLKRQKADFNNSGRNHRASDDRAKQEVFADVTGSQQVEHVSQELNKANELALSQGGPDRVTKKRAIAVPCKEADAKGSIIRQTAAPRLSNLSAENNLQARSISELAAYKKQYYDTLLSVQRAKVAVTNSLASASDHFTVYGDPYYSNYACQQQHLFQRQRQFTMRPQFSTCPTALSGLPGAHGNQYSWARSDCKYLLLKQLRLRRQTSPAYGRNQGGWIHRYVGPMYPYPFEPSGSGQTEQCVRRKSLEDIVGKLKGVERSGVDN